MKGRTCVVTGATSGIGKETARALAALGADVLLVSRDAAKLQATAAEIGAAGSVRCDFGRLASIRAAAEEVRHGRDEIHVLVLNAGAMHATRKASSDGHELTFATNHLGYFLFARLLLPRLELAGRSDRKARIVVVASHAHRRGRIDFQDPMYDERPYDAFDAYAQSKLCNVVFTYELSRRLEGKNVTANCLHPGVVATGFGRNDPGWIRFALGLARPFLRTPADGARASIRLATAEELEGVTGTYFGPEGEPAKSSPASLDPVTHRRLWELSERLTGLR